MDATHDDLSREIALFSERIDPVAREVVDAADPWDAYDAVVKLQAALSDDLDWLPHGGGVYVAWAELGDLYETGKTPIPDAHVALRQAATDWLQRRPIPDGTYIDRWVKSTTQSVRFLFDRDGDFWR